MRWGRVQWQLLGGVDGNETECSIVGELETTPQVCNVRPCSDIILSNRTLAWYCTQGIYSIMHSVWLYSVFSMVGYAYGSPLNAISCAGTVHALPVPSAALLPQCGPELEYLHTASEYSVMYDIGRWLFVVCWLDFTLVALVAWLVLKIDRVEMFVCAHIITI